MTIDEVRNANYKELVAFAKENGIKYFGVKKNELADDIIAFLNPKSNYDDMPTAPTPEPTQEPVKKKEGFFPFRR